MQKQELASGGSCFLRLRGWMVASGKSIVICLMEDRANAFRSKKRPFLGSIINPLRMALKSRHCSPGAFDRRLLPYRFNLISRYYIH